MIALDSSAVVELLARSAGGDAVRALLAGQPAVAPDLLDAEVFSRQARLHRGGLITAGELEERLGLLAALDAVRIPVASLLLPALEMLGALSPFDAIFAACAKVMGCPLVTTDARLAATAAAQYQVAVTVVPRSG